MGKNQNKEQIIYKKVQEAERQKRKSCKPENNKGDKWVDPINNPHSTIKTGFHGIPKDKWEKAFGKKNTKKKKSNKKT